MRALLLFVLLISVASPASAHRLDEYLQATTIALKHDRIDMRLRLLPGVDVANEVLASIDRDRDGALSGIEQRAYAEQVRGDLALLVDNRERPIRLAGIAFPEPATLRGGAGEILIELEAKAPDGDGKHSLQLENRHQHTLAVYLVNTLLPRDPRIGIVMQDRSYDQSSYRLTYTIGTSAANSPALDLNRQDGSATLRTFFLQGVRHILTGCDHLLFIAALVLGAATLWDLLKVVTAFTIAHSATLTFAALGLVHVPSQIVEPMIAGSIVFVAVQNVLRPAAARRTSRLLVAFLFGLFHGLGFAGGLLDLLHGMRGSMFLLAVVGFSLGIEVGNQIVLLPLLGARQLSHAGQQGRWNRSRAAARFTAVASCAIALGGTGYLAVAISLALK